jgi:hypothetical protein
VAIAVEGLHAARLGVVPPWRREIEAAAEERAGTGQDDGTHAVVAACRFERRVEIREQRFLERVCRRAIEREEPNAAGVVFAADGDRQSWISGGMMKLGLAWAMT